MKKLLKQLLSFLPFAVMANNPVIEREKEPPIPPEIMKEQWTNNPTRRVHNNRRNTPGRFVQYVNVGEGRQRAIYHSAR